MAIIDPTYLYRERNLFPSLTDKEFETLSIYCQTASYKIVAEYRNCTERQVLKHIDSCKRKLKVSNEFGIFFSFISRCVDYRLLYPTLSEEQATLLYIYALLGNQVRLSHVTGYPRKEIRSELIKIKEALRVKDVSSLRICFVIKITLFKR